MTPYECCYHYTGIKLHFTTSYDYVKYNGKVQLTKEQFEKRKDKFFFQKLSKKYSKQEELIEFLISNFIDKDKVWVGDLLLEQATSNYQNRQKILQSLSYIFENDCSFLFYEINNPNEILITNGDYPILLKKTLQQDIHFESFCILNMILNFFPMWKNKISDNVYWPTVCKKVEKYSCFLPKDHVKYKKILKKVLSDC